MQLQLQLKASASGTQASSGIVLLGIEMSLQELGLGGLA